MKIKISARKYMGDDKYSWAVFRSDILKPVFTGLSRREVSYYKKLVQEEIDKKTNKKLS